jgi:L-aspartate oxidase
MTPTTVPNLIIGSGIAGLSLALKLARRQQVLVIAKAKLTDSNTFWAQGGIASVLDAADSFDRHVDDTLVAGAGLCHRPIVEQVVTAGPRMIKELIDLGVPFSGLDEGGLHLTREGGHSHRRVIHVDDATGSAVIRVLIERAKRDPNITILEDHLAIDLLTTDKLAPDFTRNTCVGAYVLDRMSGEAFEVRARNTFLCTGGHGKVYLYTSNPDSATGDGVAMAWRAGCRVANLEFMQFHPTCLYHPQAKTFLISEAVRGEGGQLKDRKGREFMRDYHPLGALAPRDIVARAIDQELKRSGDTNVFLDVRHLGEEKILKHFPNIHATCLRYGIDMRSEMIPVVPAAHYSCGGVVTDGAGRTSVRGLYVLGEAACTGLHGANRLASNSLLEALVFADAASRDVLGESPHVPPADLHQALDVPPWKRGAAKPPADELVVLNQTWDEIRRLMWHYVGIVRSDARLKRAMSRITVIREELDQFYWDYEISAALLEVRNLAQVAQLTIRCAMARKESRGIHYNIDHPDMDERYGARDSVLR